MCTSKEVKEPSHSSQDAPINSQVQVDAYISEEVFCGQCGELYVKKTAEIEMWVASEL